MNVSRLATTVASTVATAHVADEIVIGASLPRT